MKAKKAPGKPSGKGPGGFRGKKAKAGNLRVALLGPVYPYRSGESQSNTILCSNLAKTHEFRAFSFKRLYPKMLYPGRAQKYGKAKKLGFEAEYCLDSLNPFTWASAYRKIRKFGPDVLIVTWWTVFLSPALFGILSLVKLFTKTRVCMFCHNVLPHERSLLDKLLTWPVLKLADYYVVLSSQTKRELTALIPGARVEKLVEPTYDSYFRQKRVPRKKAQEKAGVSGNVALFFGLVREYKGLDFLLKAMPSVRKDVTLLVVGEFWEDKAKYDSLVKELGLKDRVKTVPRFVSDAEAAVYFAASDVFVLPYTSATYSGIIQVAYGFSKPVIVSDVEGLTDYVDGGKTGFIVPPKNPEALAAAINKFYRSDRKGMEKNVARKREIFRWNAEKEKVLFHGL